MLKKFDRIHVWSEDSSQTVDLILVSSEHTLNCDKTHPLIRYHTMHVFRYILDDAYITLCLCFVISISHSLFDELDKKINKKKIEMMN